MLIHFSHVLLFAIQWTAASLAPLSVHGFLRGRIQESEWAGILEWVPGDLPDPGIEPVSPASPEMQADSLPKSFWGSIFNI